jgi:class 3 adenylate cyclase
VRAVHCGLAIRDGARQLGLAVRVGIHTGEIERRGEDIAGIGVHIAARVQSCAQPGEVWVSRTVTDVVAGSDIAFTDRGTRELKGIPGPWQLYSAD